MNILISSPPYTHRSGGIRVLHYLGYLCYQLGHNVQMNSTYCNPVWGKYSAPLNHKPDITILPEINPPSEPGLNVVRWVLYFPGAIGGGPTTYPSHELVVSYHDAYNEAANAAATRKPILNFRLPFCEKIDLSQMPLSGPTRKIKNVVWYGKGPRIPCNDIHCAIEITREWPSKRNEL